jgi:predicted peptidase
MNRNVLAVTAGLALCTLAPAAERRETGFLDRTVISDGVTFRYQVYVPSDYNSDVKLPIVLFLHGAGERGDDGLAQTNVGIGTAIRAHPDRYHAIIVMPQCGKGVWWQDTAMETQALASLDQSIKEFHTDPDRVYLTGLSMGGYGSWALLQKYPGRFAAAVVICGGIVPPPSTKLPAPPGDDPYGDAAKKIGTSMPIWVFHGGADPVVPVTESRKMVEALKALGSNVKYTEFDGVLHDSWVKAYNDTAMPPWLFGQSRKANTAGGTLQ